MVIISVVGIGSGGQENQARLLSKFSLEVSQNGGTGASWIINLEGSLDGINWTPILTHTNTDPGDAQIITTGAGGFPCLWRRLTVVSLSLGTNPNLTLKYEGTT